MLETLWTPICQEVLSQTALEQWPRINEKELKTINWYLRGRDFRELVTGKNIDQVTFMVAFVNKINLSYIPVAIPVA